MKRIIYTALLIVAVQVTGMAQAVLPASWGFDNATFPSGWTTNFTYESYNGGDPAPALKFGVQGRYLQIHYAGAAGTVAYKIAGNSFTPGAFDVQESVDGTAWTTVFTHAADIQTTGAGAYTAKVQNLQAASRYVRFIFTTKNAGNVGLDNVVISPAAATAEQEINVKDGSTTVINNGTVTFSSNVGVAAPKTLVIENSGLTNALTITSATLTGANASEYTLGTVPTSVAATSSANLLVTFTPTSTGTKNATLTIVNNDADENPYVINLVGYGGGLASEPTVQATNLTFTNVKTYRFNSSFTAAAGVEGYLVLRKKGSAITGAPVDGTVYQRGDIVGDAQVVFSGTNTAFTPNNIVAATGYHFAVFTYNGSGTGRNYNTTSPLTGTVTTPATMQPANYYNAINTGSTTFVADLHNLVYPHTQRYYSDYAVKMIQLFASRDTVANQRVVTCVYSGQNQVYTEPFIYTPNNFSREHSYCHSWMPIFNDPNSEDTKAYSDYHHLYPTNQNDVNAIRSNLPLGKVVSGATSYLGAKVGLDANGKKVYEPRDEHKGDAARAIFYEAIAYNTVDGKDWKLPSYISTTIPYGQDQSILKQWSMNDLPSSWEISRNDFIDSLQGNRNPFIDNPEYVCYINFSNMAYESLGCTAGIEEELAAAFLMYPNPAKKELTLHVDGTTISNYEIIDMQGRKVASVEVSNLSVVKINTESIHSGSYVVKVTTPYGNVQRSLIVE